MRDITPLERIEEGGKFETRCTKKKGTVLQQNVGSVKVKWDKKDLDIDAGMQDIQIISSFTEVRKI